MSGHHFNPVYLLPLVEVVGGERTSTEAIERALGFYRRIGMRPLHVKQEIEGYLSDRLQEALWRENLHLAAESVATTEELDNAIVYGPGLRWALMGVNLTFHMAGGEEGMYDADNERLLSTGEYMLMNADASGPGSGPFAGEVHERLKLLRRAHEALSIPERAGSSIGIR